MRIFHAGGGAAARRPSACRLCLAASERGLRSLCCARPPARCRCASTATSSRGQRTRSGARRLISSSWIPRRRWMRSRPARGLRPGRGLGVVDEEAGLFARGFSLPRPASRGRGDRLRRPAPYRQLDREIEIRQGMGRCILRPPFGPDRPRSRVVWLWKRCAITRWTEGSNTRGDRMPPERLELSAFRLKVCCSSQLSYGGRHRRRGAP